jgi:ATP-dependent Clp protease adaptor protein ClpS
MSSKKSTKRGKYEIFILNDNQHSFDEVIAALTEICGHNRFQAEQCAVITHNMGQCSVFIDKHDASIEIYEELVKTGLNCKIQKR